VSEYKEFLATKKLVFMDTGKGVDDADVHQMLFPFQRDLTRWALRKGRSAIFADTGLGKTLMQVEWARLTGCNTLIVAPLSVARQTVREAKKIGVDVEYVREQPEGHGIFITNYEMIDKFDASKFGAIVLDESSILKSLDSKTRQKLIDMFSDVPYRLCCTATPAPNDISEIANHAEFLGIMSRVDMLACFFVHESNTKNAQGWRIKGHAVESFYKWMASWGMSVRRPSDLGYSDDGFDLPELSIDPLYVDAGYVPSDRLFLDEIKGIQDRARVRRETIGAKVEAAAKMVAESDEQWIVWCGLNAESDAMSKAIDGAVNVQGSDSLDYKSDRLEAFQAEEFRVLVSKPKIAGFGMNFQNCHNMLFVGLSDSWESYYQAIRRCYRFGQKNPVNVHIVLADIEKDIFTNVMRKEAQANVMSEELIKNVQQYEREEIEEASAVEFNYAESEESGDGWKIKLGDSTERLREVDTDSIGLSVFSPPFLSLYTYSPTERDLGNSKTPTEFFEHFQYIIDELLRVTMPGRNCAVHVAQVPATKIHDGYIGLKDFRGDVIRAFDDRGWHYYGEVCIDKDPQAQAIRTKAKSLMFVTLNKDSSSLRPALADYVLVFKKPGDNTQPVLPVESGEMDNNTWIEWARPIWYNIRETNTLNVRVARTEKDERHICPLQLETIERCVKLWSNPGDLILDPFAGIGSTGYVAVENNREFVGIELKPEYFAVAVNNLHAAQRKATPLDLFSEVESDDLSEDRAGDRTSASEVSSVS
jgi:superfamily II DNA or RNA helicase